MRRLW